MTAAPQRGAGALDWLLVALLVACAALAAFLELLLVPLRAGEALVPVAVVLAVVSNVVFPRMAARLTPSVLATALPFAGWLVVAVGFGVLARPEGDVVLPGGGYVEYVGYATLLGGALAGTVTVVMCAPGPRPRAGAADGPGDSRVRGGDRTGR